METETLHPQFDPASFEHIPVLLNECLDGLAIDPAGIYLDGTAGGAGHSRQIALRLDAAKGGRLISLETPLSETMFTGYTRLYVPVVVSAPGCKSGAIVRVRLGQYDGERVRAQLL